MRRVSKAQGYQIYRAEGKKWKVIKTIKSGKKVTFVDKKVKKNKVYRYKVRAYGTVKGKKVYGNFGYVCKASLKKPTVKGAYKKGSIYGPALNNNQLMQVRRDVQSFKTNYIKKGMSNYEKAFIAFNYLNRIVSMRQEAGSIMEQIQLGEHWYMVKHSALDMQEG